MPTWIQLVFLACGVCFILALKGLSGPKTARNGNLIGAARGRGRLRDAVLLDRAPPAPRPADPRRDRDRHRRRRRTAPARVQMTQMPQMVALFNGVGGGAAALVALLELQRGRRRRRPRLVVQPRGDGVHDRRRRGLLRRLGGHLRQAPGADDLAAGGLPRPADRLRRRRCSASLALSVMLVDDPRMWVGIVLGLLGLLVGVLLVLPVGGADVPIVISLLNAFTGLTVAAGGYVLSNVLLLVAGTLVGASGTFLTLLMARAMGRSVRQHPLRCAQGRLDARRRRGLATGRSSRATPEDVAIMLAYADRVIIVPGLRPRRRPGPAHAARARRRARRARHRGRLRDPPGRRPDARPHERAARRGPGALRAAARDGRHQRRLQGRRRRARRRRQRRRQPGRQDHARARRSTGCRSSTPTRPSRSSS